ncbi:MAG: rhodanese-like domain-containing protein [Alphaproteobacteria bacterium]|nr:rhodanese-like domain-containing protein [Alphaproteobacteria bacterium]
MMKTITVDALHDHFNDYFVVDVREEHEIAAQSIAGTIKYPLSQWHEPFFETVKPIVFLCRSGQRSQLAAQRYMETQPTAVVYNLTGGILAWHAGGYPVLP